jgi:Pyruvate phosphate dikinase, AMP/ATP-binding domain
MKPRLDGPKDTNSKLVLALRVLDFQETDRTKLMLAGGKGANLGELSAISGIRVPDGFCVTTEAYKKYRKSPGTERLAGYISMFESRRALNYQRTQ